MLGQIPVLVEFAESIKLWRNSTKSVYGFFFCVFSVWGTVTVINYVRWNVSARLAPPKKAKKKIS